MISILVSTYNYDCYRLVCDLHSQCKQLGHPFEILVGDDHSRDQLTVISNRKISELSDCHYFYSSENSGPARNRNMLAEKSKGEWLIFIDSDAKVDNPHFIKNYVDSIGVADVVVGGVKTPILSNDEIVTTCITADLGALHSKFIVNRTLRYKYERNADKIRSAANRSVNPYHNMSSFNFMISKSAFMAVKFDEQCREYGFEDTLFGAELQRKGLTIKHIDNQLLHMGIDTNEKFLEKTQISLRSLKSLGDKMKGYSKVYDMACRLRSNHMAWSVKLMYLLSKKLLEINLLSKKPSLFVFSFYKLGFFLCLK